MDMSQRDSFINEELIATDPFTFSRFSKSFNHGFGGLGNGILRPKQTTIKEKFEFDVILPDYKNSLLQLTDKDSTEKLAKQIATSIQNRIDKAGLKEQEETVVIEEENGKSPLLIGSMIVGGLIVTGILIYVFKKSKTPKLKTA